MTSNLQIAEQETKNWYRLMRSGIPEVGTLEFAHFAGQSSSFMSMINSKDLPKFKFVIDTKSDSAYIDIPKSIIAIPAWYLDPKAVLELNSEIEDVSVASTILINGSMIHEPLHSAYTPKTLQALVNSLGADRANSLYEDYGSFADRVANIIEDLFIESAPLAKFGYYRFFIDGKNAIMFSQSKFDEVSNDFAEASTLANAMNVAVSFKNTELRSSGIFTKLPEDAHKALVEATKLSEDASFQDRAELVEMFCRAFEKPSESEKSSSGSEGGDGESTKIDGTPEPSSEGMSEKGDAVPSEMIGEFEKSSEEAADKVSSRLYEDYDGTFVGKPQEFDIMKFSDKSRHTHVLESTGNYSFIQNIMRLRTKNHTSGEALNHGSHLVNTRISRIATDGKIFSRQNAERQVEKQVEIISLVDASGSMGPLFSKVLSASKDIHQACRKLNMSNAVYAHTSFIPRSGEQTPCLIHISSYNMCRTNGNVEERFEEATKINLRENFDGHMIEEVSKKFTKRNSRKVLIVLSDGEPSGPGYRYDFATQHTKKAIANARKAGIVVICMSLVNHVISANNKIYGREFNIDATSNVKSEFERIITNANKE